MLNEFNTESKVLIWAQNMEISRTLNKLVYHNNVTIVCRSQILLTRSILQLTGNVLLLRL